MKIGSLFSKFTDLPTLAKKILNLDKQQFATLRIHTKELKHNIHKEKQETFIINAERIQLV